MSSVRVHRAGGPHAAGIGVGHRDGGWPAEAHGDAITAPYSAQSAGPLPWHVYRLRIATVFGVGLRELRGASRWRF